MLSPSDKNQPQRMDTRKCLHEKVLHPLRLRQYENWFCLGKPL